MTKSTFEIQVEADGTEFVYQAIDEMDKNHGIEDTENTNKGHMYATGGEQNPLIYLFLLLQITEQECILMTK